MKKFTRVGYIICIAFTVSLTLSGCTIRGVPREKINIDGKEITILSTSPSLKSEKVVPSDDFTIEKISLYNGIRGEDWLSDDTILITKENAEMEPIAVFDQMSKIRNLYSYNLKTGEEKSIYDETEYMWMPIISPDKKYIFSENVKSGNYSGLILDLDGQVKATVKEDTAKGFHISFNNAKWVDKETVIVPTSGDGVSLINVNSNILHIEDIGEMQTDSAVMVGNKIYYVSVERNLIAYDINSKQKEIVKKNVLNFELSPNKDLFAIEKKISEGKNALMIIDVDGNEKTTLTEGKMVFGISWSPDQSKIAYVVTTIDESNSGLYVMDLNSQNSLYVSSDYLGIDNGLKWSPSSDKILASIVEVKEMKAIDNTYVITLN